jgi:peptidoglycan/LPS O-acetylase OafA/YrhL
MDKQIGSLTSLRGIAATIVVILHLAYSTLPQAGVVLSAHTHFFRNGYLCVDLFFILSGFIMTHVYLDRFYLGASKSNYWAYLCTRFARIYPLHLFTLAFLVGLEICKLGLPNAQAFTGKFNLTALVANIFLLQAFDFNCPPLLWCKTFWNEPAWSISVEFITYLIFPVLLYLLLKTNLKTDAIGYLATLIALFLLIKFTRGNLDTLIGIPSIARSGLECVLGMITYKFYRWGEYRNYLKLDILAIVSVMWVTWIMHNWIDNFRGLHDWSILPAFSLLILAIAPKHNGFISKLMNSPLLLYLGTISYSIYLVHWCLAELLKTFWLYRFQMEIATALDRSQSLLAVMLMLPLVFFTASLTYRFVEVPMRDRLRPKAQFLT